MKRIISYILISFIISANLLAPISVGWGVKNDSNFKINKAEAKDCTIDSVTFNPATDLTLDNARPPTTTLTVSTTGCTGLMFAGQIVSSNASFRSRLLSFPSQEITLDTFSFNITTGENNCSFGSCKVLLSVYINKMDGSGASGSYNSKVVEGSNDFLYYKCDNNKCDDTKTWSITTREGISQSSVWSINPSLATSTGFKVSGIGPIKAHNTASISYNKSDTMTLTVNNLDGTLAQKISYNINNDLTSNDAISYSAEFDKLQPGKGYNLVLTTSKGEKQILNGLYTLSTEGTIIQQLPGDNSGRGTTQNSNTSTLPACSVDPFTKGTFMGCVVQLFYYVLFVPTSYLFALAGTMFDYTFSYSVQDTSYRSAFVVQGWGLIRDFCNMFFIFIMLYVAIGTILSLHSMKTKETIINVVIIGLFINFSLFATQVIIDASNITARVFYNSNAIKITEKGAIGVAKATPGLEIGADGTIPLSAAIVNKVNPQNLIMSASKVSSIKNNNSTSGVGGVNADSLGVMQFILVIIMASAVNIVGFTVFITVAFLFIARVVGLWMAMILAPVAFFTYILPEMAGTKMIGWKNWWPETLKLAFLAPVFIFFMYLILKFLQANLITDIVGKSMSGDGLGYFVAILVPFAFIMILMMKAKKIAIDMSGEFGEMAVKAGSAVGGMALGGAVGLGAIAGRATLGRLGSSIANSKALAGAEAKGGMFGMGAKALRNIGTGASKASFDARNTKLGASAGSSMGVDIGKGKTGGYKQAESDRIAQRTQRLDELKKVSTHGLEVKKRKAEVGKKLLENNNIDKLHEIDKQLEIKRQNLKDAATPQAREEIAKEITELKTEKTNISNGNVIPGKKNPDGTQKYNTDNGNMTKTEAEKTEQQAIEAEAEAKEKEDWAAQVQADTSLSQPDKDETRIAAETARALANDAKAKQEQAKKIIESGNFGKSINELTKAISHTQIEIDKEGNKLAGLYVENINSGLNKVVNIFSAGDTARGRDEASDKMLLGMVVKSSGGDHGHAKPAAHAEPAHKEKKGGEHKTGNDHTAPGGDGHGH